MKDSLKSSIYMDFQMELHADVADDLGIDLSRESRCLRAVFVNQGFVAAQRWLEQYLLEPVQFGTYPDTHGKPRYSQLIDLFCDRRSGWIPGAARAYAHARQLVYSFRKLQDVQCLESDVDAMSKFKDRMVELRHPLSSDQHELCSALRERFNEFIPNDLCASYDPAAIAESAPPDIGPGASFEKRPKALRLEYFYDGRFSFPGAKFEDCGSASRAVCVPKDYTKKRLIFVEPASRMLMQKGLQAFLYEAARRCPLRNYVSFTLQEVQHAKLRRVGAASIDLSDASDYIDRRLVWLTLRDRPVLRSCLFKARGVATPDGVALGCFGTMGNATTFPIMTIFLACVLSIAEDEARARSAKIWRGGVFGDDIVCHEVVYGSVIGMLKRLGLKPNRKKSYVDKLFLESCGLDLYEGADVTPIKVKSLSNSGSADHARLIQYVNSLFTAGYWRTSDAVLSHLLEGFPHTSFGPYGMPDVIWSYVLDDCDGPWDRFLQERRPWLPRKSAKATENYDSEAQLSYWLLHGRRAADIVPEQY